MVLGPEVDYTAVAIFGILAVVASIFQVDLFGRSAVSVAPAYLVGGAVLGGIAGNMIGTAAGTKQGIAVTVEFNDGNVNAFVQPADTNIQPGQRVNVEFREDGAYVVPVQYAPGY